MSTVSKDVKPAKSLPEASGDFYELAETLPAEELGTLMQVREFMQRKVAPVINKYWAGDRFPLELVPALKDLNVMGAGLEGYGCHGGRVPRMKCVSGFSACEPSTVE